MTKSEEREKNMLNKEVKTSNNMPCRLLKPQIPIFKFTFNILHNTIEIDESFYDLLGLVHDNRKIKINKFVRWILPEYRKKFYSSLRKLIKHNILDASFAFLMMGSEKKFNILINLIYKENKESTISIISGFLVIISLEMFVSDISDSCKEQFSDILYILDSKSNNITLTELFNELLCINEPYLEESTKNKKYEYIGKQNKNIIKEYIFKNSPSYNDLSKYPYLAISESGVPVRIFVQRYFVYSFENELIYTIGSIYILNDLMIENSHLSPNCTIEKGSFTYYQRHFNVDMRKLLDCKDQFGYIVQVAINNLNSTSDLYGDSTCEKMTDEISFRIRESIPENMNFYRLNEGRFLINFYKMSKNDVINWTRLFSVVNNERLIWKEHELRFDITFAVVEYPANAATLEELLLNIKISYEKNKNTSLNCFNVFSYEDREEYLSKLSLEDKLINAVQNDFQGFVIYYQPQFSAENLQCVSVEALLRWYDSDLGIISPEIFIPYLESLNLISEVTEWMLEKIISQCNRWIAMGISEDFSISVNISALQIVQGTIGTEILNLLRDYKLNPKHITLEITESYFINNFEKCIDFLNDMRSNGISISIDDFGTGYSSLQYLSKLPIDEIKIASYFVWNMDIDFGMAKIIDAIIFISKSLNFRICVEGIETKKQEKYFLEKNVDIFQGYYYSKPISSHDFEKTFIIEQSTKV